MTQTSLSSMTHAEKIKAAGIRKHGSEEAWRAFQRDAGSKVRNRGRGYFGKLKAEDPAKLSELSKIGGKARHAETDRDKL